MRKLLIEMIASAALALLLYYIGVALFGDSRWVSGAAAGLAVLIVRLAVRYWRPRYADHA